MVAFVSFCGTCEGKNYKHFSRVEEFRWGPWLCALWLQLQEEREEVGGKRSHVGEGRVTSDPTDRLILSFQRPPLSLLFTSLKEQRGGVKKEQAGIMKLVLEGTRWKRMRRRRREAEWRVINKWRAVGLVSVSASRLELHLHLSLKAAGLKRYNWWSDGWELCPWLARVEMMLLQALDTLGQVEHRWSLTCIHPQTQNTPGTALGRHHILHFLTTPPQLYNTVWNSSVQMWTELPWPR